MKATILIDNKKKDSTLKSEWGLSVYVEFQDKKILLDTGYHGPFLSNAQKLGIDLSQVDYGVLSHAHCDHANGMNKFFSVNSKAKFYLQKSASENCYTKFLFLRPYCGIKKGFTKKFSSRIEYVGKHQLCKDVWLLPHTTQGLEDKGKAAGLYVKENGKLNYDSFRHEQSLIFDTPKGLVVMNSCSHGGADNIIREAQEAFPGKKINTILGGFHLFCLPDEEVKAFGERLKDLDVENIYTGHCTGDHAYDLLKEILGDRVQQMYTGMELEF